MAINVPVNSAAEEFEQCSPLRNISVTSSWMLHNHQVDMTNIKETDINKRL